MKKIFSIFIFIFMVVSVSLVVDAAYEDGGDGGDGWHTFDDYVGAGYYWDDFTSEAYKSTYNPIYAEFEYVEKGFDLTAAENSNRIDTCNTSWVPAGSASTDRTYIVCGSHDAPTNKYVNLMGRQPFFTFTDGIVQGRWIED